MTKYVLNSGGVKRHLDLKRKFHREIVEGLGDKPKILLCNFAQGREYWESKFPGYSNAIAEDMPTGTKPTFELALPDNFIQQCKNADVIYFHGGDDHLIKYWMKQFDLPTIFKNKVVATNSASSDMLASSYWTCDWRKCQDGFGILPIKFIPHYDSDFGKDDPRGPIDWEKAKQELENYGDKTLPVHALREGEFIKYEIS
jgi:hypothetical protein